MFDEKLRSVLKNVFSHPLVLLLLAAGISGLLVPSITSQWQNHQKELELKTGLVTQISKAVADIMIVSRIVQIPAYAYTNQSYPNAYEQWEISKATIGSQLEAYFPEDQIKQKWDNLTSAITEFSGLSPLLTKKNISQSDYALKLCTRILHVLNLHAYLDHGYPININYDDLKTYSCQGVANQQELEKYSPNPYDIDWKVLVYKDRYSYPPYFKNLLTLQNKLEDQKDNLVKSILSTHISVF